MAFLARLRESLTSELEVTRPRMTKEVVKDMVENLSTALSNGFAKQ
jgi:hypothetical protein